MSLSPMTSLEQAWARATEVRMHDGTWTRIFGGMTGVQKSSTCTGNFEAWPMPSVEPGTDLASVIDRGEFRCGFVDNYRIAPPDSEGESLIDTTKDGIDGAIIEWFDAIGEELSQMLETSISVTWDYQNKTSQQILDGVYNGELDAACGAFNPDGVWKNPDGELVARASAFSLGTCQSFLRNTFVYSRLHSYIRSYTDLINAIDDGSIDKVCTPGYGVGATCTNTIREYLDTDVECIGVGTDDEAFALLQEGECNVVFDGAPGAYFSSFQHFEQPVTHSPVSLFRPADYCQMVMATSGKTSLRTGTNNALLGGCVVPPEATLVPTSAAGLVPFQPLLLMTVLLLTNRLYA